MPVNSQSSLNAARRRWWVVLIFGAAGMLVGALPSPGRVTDESDVRRFSATHVMLLNTSQEVLAGEVLPQQVALLATVGEVPRRAAEAIGYTGEPANLARQVTVDLSFETGALTISTVQPSAQQAQLIVDTFADVTAEYLVEREGEKLEARLESSLERVGEVEQQLDEIDTQLAENPTDSVLQAQRESLIRQYSAALAANDALSESSSLLSFTSLGPATAVEIDSARFSAPRSRQARGLLGLIVGVCVGLGVAVVLGRLDRRVRTRDQAEQVTGLRSRVAIPKVSDDRRSNLVVLPESHDVLSDAYRTLRNVINFVQSGLEPSTRGRTTLVVSPGPGEGKTALTVNLGAAFAESGLNTVAVNTDFRRPQLAKWLRSEPVEPLPFTLEDLEWLPVERLLQRTIVPGLTMLDLESLGAAPEMARTTASIVPQLAEMCDAIVIDTSPVGATAEVLEMVPLADVIVVVVRAGRTYVDTARETVEILRDLTTAPLILVLTGVHQDRPRYYYAYADQRRGKSRRSRPNSLGHLAGAHGNGHAENHHAPGATEGLAPPSETERAHSVTEGLAPPSETERAHSDPQHD